MNQTPQTPKKRSLSIADTNNLKVLVVDPNAYMRGIVADALRRLSIGEISTTSSTDEAQDICLSFRPNIVITDWEAGRLSGLEFTRSIRRSEKNIPRDIPVILLASTVARDQIMAARQAGINEFLLKPVSVRALKSRIEEVVIRPRKFIDSRHYIGPCRRRKMDTEFSGPWRRLTDEPPLESLADDSPAHVDKLRAIVAQLSGFAVRDASDTTGIVRGLYKLLSKHSQDIEQIGDKTVTEIWASAQRYLEGVGMTPYYDAKVILRHFEGIAAVMDVPRSDILRRQALIRDLSRLVTKKIHSIESDVRGAVGK
ncbi:response regulator receiver protein [Hirschia baltica ATCC 49814]|uniref:Response regulator receiver protein n=1 Tax=Hirschia baltica (strain ATCC 49814 / DSM 5838 / IFAM 1418) TaxID=582402 RepID=C6XQK4_HIRBI|nr:response regulator receiver protein [Hirschia baltica ATCC 49814]